MANLKCRAIRQRLWDSKTVTVDVAEIEGDDQVILKIQQTTGPAGVTTKIQIGFLGPDEDAERFANPEENPDFFEPHWRWVELDRLELGRLLG